MLKKVIEPVQRDEPVVRVACFFECLVYRGQVARRRHLQVLCAIQGEHGNGDVAQVVGWVELEKLHHPRRKYLCSNTFGLRFQLRRLFFEQFENLLAPRLDASFFYCNRIEL